ncbi:hypothetical protein [Mesorhizobium sp. WSM3224]|uniref:hypothetical protein n=1 Tax=Mesorhizobium sp. WSM3224 TaxID=1040986 RepID=UPI001FD8B436|nr:hypothetical protein [Mesorhizobium sp. WSM3224]
MNNADLAILGGITVFVLLGVYLVLRRILIAVRQRRLKPNPYLSEYRPTPLDEVPWVWERPVELAGGPASSQSAVPSDPDALSRDANHRQFGVRIEHFDISEAGESSPGGQPSAIASTTNIATASPPRVRRQIGLATRLGVTIICLVVPLGFAMTRQNQVESAPAMSHAQGDLSRPFELPASSPVGMRGPAQADERTRVELLGPDSAAAKAQVKAALAQAAAARELAGQEHRAMEGERARSASLQSALFESRRQIDALKTSMAAADNANEERLRNELAAARTLDALRWIAQDARALLGKTMNYVFVQMPAARLERQRTEQMARDLSQAREQIEQLEDKATADRARAEVSLAQASGMLDEERRKSADLRGNLAEMQQTRAAAADMTERERTGAATARARADQTAAETAQTLARERAATASTHEDLNKARLERDAAEQERTRAVSAKQRAEQTVAETAQALARERAATASTREDLNKARLERDAAEQERTKAVTARERAEQTAAETAQAQARERAVSAEDLNKARLGAAQALLGQVTRLNEALDQQRESTVSLARDLAAARADNDRLRADRRSAQIEPPLKPRSGRPSAGTGQVKAVSQKTTRSKARNPSRVIRVRSITLPFSLRPSHSTLD